MRAGSLNKIVTFQAHTSTPDTGGGSSTAWTDVVDAWGAFSPERGQERVEAGRLQASLGGVLRVRSSSQTREITEAHQVLIDNEPYQIRSIANPDGRHIVLEMTVEKGVAT